MTTPRVIPSTLTREVAKIVADILQVEMVLDESHCLLGNQKWDIPADKLLFVVVFDKAGPSFGAANYLDTDETSDTYGKEIQQSSVLHDVTVEIMSFDADARLRKEEVGMALASMYAQQQAEEYGIQIGRAQAPVDASDAEPTGTLQRFVIRTNITALHQKVKNPPTGTDYFNKFNGATVDGTIDPPQTDIEE